MADFLTWIMWSAVIGGGLAGAITAARIVCALREINSRFNDRHGR